MYTLVFIILVPVSGIDRITELERYPSEDACQSEKIRILKEMQKVYPDDKTWSLECRLTGQRIVWTPKYLN